MTEKNKIEMDKEKIKKERNTDKDYPYISLEDAVDVAKKINEFGGYISKEELGQVLDRKGGWLGITIVSAKRYGLIEGYGKLNLTELAKKIISPTYEGENKKGMKEAFMGVKLFAEIYNRFKGKYPENELFINILIRNYGVRDKKEAIRIIKIIKKATQELFEENELSENVTNSQEDNGDYKIKNMLETNNKKITIIIKAPGVNYPFYADNSKEFETIIKKKLPIAIESVRNSLKLLELEYSNEEVEEHEK